FTALGARVLGISVESDRAHTAFAKALDLPFPLLSDFNREIVQRFGIAYGPHEARGGLWGFSRRSVYVIDQQPVIRYAWISEDTAVEPDIEEVLAAVQALGAA